MDRLHRLSELPPPPPGRTGWPWTEETPPHAAPPGTAWPRITIVTASYNQAAFLEETIRSVLLQAYPNLEYIVMDGGSSDGSPEIIRRYSPYLAYWTSEKDKGASDAIAKGFFRATGTILAYLNSDDTFRPGSLQAVAKSMTDDSVGVAYGNMYWIDTAGQFIGEQRHTPFMKLAYLYGGSTLPQPATFWKRDLYQACGGMDPAYRFAFDTDLFFRFVRKGARFKHINRFLASFRIHPQSKSSNDADICSQELSRLRQAHLPFPFGSFRGKCVRGMATVYRTCWYTLQGDLLWLLGRIPDRIRARNAETIVGPRGRRV